MKAQHWSFIKGAGKIASSEECAFPLQGSEFYSQHQAQAAHNFLDLEVQGNLTLSRPLWYLYSHAHTHIEIHRLHRETLSGNNNKILKQTHIELGHEENRNSFVRGGISAPEWNMLNSCHRKLTCCDWQNNRPGQGLSHLHWFFVVKVRASQLVCLMNCTKISSVPPKTVQRLLWRFTLLTIICAGDF